MKRSSWSFVLIAAIGVLIFNGLAAAGAQCTLPFNISNGQTADATQVMANFNALLNCVNSAAPAGPTNAVQYNAGSGAAGGVGPLTNGQLVIGSTGGPPQAAALVAGSGVTITNGPGSVTIAAAGGGGSSTFSWVRLVLINNSGGNAFSWSETTVRDMSGAAQVFVSARSSQVYTGSPAYPSLAFDGNTATAWSSIDRALNFFDVQFASAFSPGSLTITARNDSNYNDGPIDILVYGSNDGVTFRSLGSVHFAPWTSAVQVQTVTLP